MNAGFITTTPMIVTDVKDVGLFNWGPSRGGGRQKKTLATNKKLFCSQGVAKKSGTKMQQRRKKSASFDSLIGKRSFRRKFDRDA